jgi:hypothetical protein
VASSEQQPHEVPAVSLTVHSCGIASLPRPGD